MKSHQFLCKFCEVEHHERRVFPTKRSLMMHIRKAHSKVETCPVCKKENVTQSQSLEDFMKHLRKNDDGHKEWREYLEEVLMSKRSTKGVTIKISVS